MWDGEAVHTHTHTHTYTHTHTHTHTHTNACTKDEKLWEGEAGSCITALKFLTRTKRRCVGRFKIGLTSPHPPTLLHPRPYLDPNLISPSPPPPTPPPPPGLASPPTLLRPRPHFTPDLISNLTSPQTLLRPLPYFTPDLTSPLTSLHSRPSSPILLHPRPYFVPYLTSPSTLLHPRHYFTPDITLPLDLHSWLSPPILLHPRPYFVPDLTSPQPYFTPALFHLWPYFTSDLTSPRTLLHLRPYFFPDLTSPSASSQVWKVSAIDLEVNTISNTNFPGLKEEKLVKLTSFRPREKIISRERVCVCLCVRVCVAHVCVRACILLADLLSQWNLPLSLTGNLHGAWQNWVRVYLCFISLTDTIKCNWRRREGHRSAWRKSLMTSFRKHPLLKPET